MSTLVYFIDGPNGAGKDYFIENLIKSLQAGAKHPPKVEVLRATDFFDNEANATERRKYVRYDTEKSKTLSIMIGHMKLLERIAELSRQRLLDSVCVVLVNRSFLSTLAYNLYKPNQLADRRFYIDLFMNVFARYSEYVDMQFINLVVNTQTLMERQKERAEGKFIDHQWTDQLINNYVQASNDLIGNGVRISFAQSGDYMKFAKEILEIKEKETEEMLAKHFLGGAPGG